MEKKKPGRLPLSEKEKLIQIWTYVKPEIRDIIKKKADESDTPFATYVRKELIMPMLKDIIKKAEE